jgi:hypothetical protein
MRLATVVFAMTLILGCERGSDTPPATPQPEATQKTWDPNPPKPETAPAASVASATGSETALEGQLVYTKIDNTRKSVDAYLGNEFAVVTASGRVNLFPSGDASAEALRGLDGKRVRVRGVMRQPSSPDPREQAPMNPDGTPMQRPGGLEVRAVEPL